MAKILAATILLTPAQKTERGFSCTLCDPGERRFTVEVAGLVALEQEVRRLVREEFKQSAAVYVALPRGARKPAGFDAVTHSFQFIEYTA